MLALTFVDPQDYEKVRQDDQVSIPDFEQFAPGTPLTISLMHSDESQDTFKCAHTYNQAQIEWVKAGSALNLIRSNSLNA